MPTRPRLGDRGAPDGLACMLWFVCGTAGRSRRSRRARLGSVMQCRLAVENHARSRRVSEIVLEWRQWNGGHLVLEWRQWNGGHLVLEWRLGNHPRPRSRPAAQVSSTRVRALVAVLRWQALRARVGALLAVSPMLLRRLKLFVQRRSVAHVSQRCPSRPRTFQSEFKPKRMASAVVRECVTQHIAVVDGLHSVANQVAEAPGIVRRWRRRQALPAGGGGGRHCQQVAEAAGIASRWRRRQQVAEAAGIASRHDARHRPDASLGVLPKL